MSVGITLVSTLQILYRRESFLTDHVLVVHLRQQGRVPDELRIHVSPLSWEHINLTGIYSWDAERQISEGFRPLRLPGKILRAG